MNKFALIAIVAIGIFTAKCFADSSSDLAVWPEVMRKGAECSALAQKKDTLVNTNMIDDIEIKLEQKQIDALETDYDVCKQEFQTSVAKF